MSECRMAFSIFFPDIDHNILSGKPVEIVPNLCPNLVNNNCLSGRNFSKPLSQLKVRLLPSSLPSLPAVDWISSTRVPWLIVTEIHPELITVHVHLKMNPGHRKVIRCDCDRYHTGCSSVLSWEVSAHCWEGSSVHRWTGFHYRVTTAQ